MTTRINFDELKEQQEQALKDAERHNAIIDAVEALGAPMPHTIPIYNSGKGTYGILGSITYEVQGHPSSSNRTWAEAADLLALFQPVAAPLAYRKMKPYAPSFVPLAWAEAAPEEQRQKEEWVDVHPICNAHVKVNGFGSEFEMLVELPGLGFFWVNFKSHSSCSFGNFTGRRKDVKGGFHYESRGFAWNAGFQALAPFRSGSTWCSPEQPGNFYAWWELPGEGQEPTAADMLRACANTNSK